jgi:hypothetical protein
MEAPLSPASFGSAMTKRVVPAVIAVRPIAPAAHAAPLATAVAVPILASYL